MHENQRRKVKLIQEITQRYYEPGRQDRCYKAVWKHYIYPIYPMCYRTYLNYISMGNLGMF